MPDDTIAASTEPFVRRALPGLLFAATLALTLVLVAWSMAVNAEDRRALFERRTEAFRLSLTAAVRSQLDILPGLRLAASGPVPLDDAHFARHAGDLLGTSRFPGLTLSFVAERVDGAGRAAYLQRVRNDRSADPAGHPNFDIHPPGERPEYMLLRHQLPADPTTDGYDLYDPGQGYRQAIDRAIADGGLIATPPLLLARDRHRPRHAELTSVVVRAATYRGDRLPTNAAERRAAASGVVGIAFRTGELVRSALPAELALPAQVRITDGGAPGPALIYDSDPAAAMGDDALRFELQVADRRWLVEAAPPPQAWWEDATEGTLALLAAGLVCAASLAALTGGLARARRQAEIRVREGLAKLGQEKALLQLSEARLRQLFEHSLDALVTSRPGGGVLAANPAACEMLGRSEALLVAAPRADILDLGDPRVAALIAQRTATGRARGQVRMKRANGSLFEAEVSTMVYKDVDGSPLASVIIRDLTSRIEAAAERQRLETQLRHAQKMEAVGTLAGGIAHDFNNVLAVVLGGSTLLEAELAEGHPGREHLARMRQAALRARTLVQQLLTFSRPPTEGMQALPLQPLVQEALALLRVTLPAGVALEPRLTEEPLHVVTEPTQLQQVLLNLGNNAVQAMPSGRGHLEVTLDVQTDAVGKRWARLAVRDDGAGMDAAVRERIFEPFFSTKAAGQGTGLGLAMVHGIVAAHGGRIEVSSAPGRGSLFEIWLPAVACSEVQPALQAPPAAARGRGERILYLDDDEVLRLTVAALLEQLGYVVQTHAEPAAALAAVAAAPRDWALVITDQDMPLMSGLEVVRAMQQLRADLPVLIVSGHLTDELYEAVEPLAHVDLLRKEFIAEQIGECINALLGRD
ncbi:ATP-binding protein [Roseateles sp.]|uniref:ATP-binding protein n=1 Tax=Roseateles sp. TaxID=1971397 RepID=UPI003BA95617